MHTFQEWRNQDEIVKMNVPFLIRILEYIREDVKTDIDLHKVVEKMLAQGNKVLTMDDYHKVGK